MEDLTLAIIKPDAVRAGNTGKIIDRIIAGGFRMAPYDGLLREVVLRMKQWTGEDLAEVIATLWAKRMAERVTALRPEIVERVEMRPFERDQIPP